MRCSAQRPASIAYYMQCWLKVSQSGTSEQQIATSVRVGPWDAYDRLDLSLDRRGLLRYDRAMAIKRVCVYCASSRQCDAATTLGRELARNKVTLVYGGGSVGSMGHLADAALAEGGS